MDDGSMLIWTNDQTMRDDEEDFVKDEWIGEVRAQLGLCDSNDAWVPDSLVNDVREAAIDAAVNEAVGNHETTIDFMEAYRSYARPEQIEKHIEEDYADELGAIVDDRVNDWLDDEKANLSNIDIHGYTALIERPGDGYSFLNEYHPSTFGSKNDKSSFENVGDLISKLQDVMDGDTVKLSVKNGELTVSESVGYVGEMEDHTVKLVENRYSNQIRNLDMNELTALMDKEGFNPNTLLEDVIVTLAERDGRTLDVAQEIADVYGWDLSDSKENESLDDICEAKSVEAEIGEEPRAEVAPETGER